MEDWATAESLFASKHFSNALFFCHLSIEKLLKGLVYVKTNEPPLYIHDLVKLAMHAKLVLPKQRIRQLAIISRWNINTRYDSYKREFYKTATKSFTTEWIKKAKEVYLWLKNQY